MMGDSRAHYEGDTLVIDTTNFSPKSDFMGSHENLHLVGSDEHPEGVDGAATASIPASALQDDASYRAGVVDLLDWSLGTRVSEAEALDRFQRVLAISESAVKMRLLRARERALERYRNLYPEEA